MPKLHFKLVGRKAYLEDEDMHHHDKLKDVLSYFSPGARYTFSYQQYLRTKNTEEPIGWNGKLSMLKRGVLSVGLLIEMQKEIKEAGFRIKIKGWKHRPSVKKKPGFRELDKKYDFQNKAVDKMLGCLRKGGGTVLAATGSGKTKTTAQFFSCIAGECLFVVDQIHLLYQAQEELAKWLKENVGIVGNSKFKPKRITVATIQTLWLHRKKPHFKKWIRGIEVVIIDELHKQMSRRNFRVVDIIKPAAVIGLTATLQMKRKEVRMKVASVAGPIIFEFPVEKGIKSGVLSKGAVVQVQIPNAPYSLAEDFDEAPDLPYQLNVIHNPAVIKCVQALVKEGVRKKLAVVILCDRIAHLKLIQKKLYDYDPAVVWGSVNQEKRERIIEKFENGKIDVIIASSVFTKGVNIKRISLIIDIAQRKNKNDALQKLGRGLRKHGSKSMLRYIDLSTEPAMKKEGSSRRNTFKKAGIPVKVITWKTSAKTILKACKEQIAS